MGSHTRRRKRSRKNFTALPFKGQLALGALAADAIVKVDVLNGNFVEDFYCISIDILLQSRAHTAGEGSFSVGFAHDDLSVTEIAEGLDANLLDPDDIIGRERARRPVWRLLSFLGLVASEIPADGRMVRRKLKMMIGNDHALAFWGRNQTAGTFTTGTIIEFQGTLYGRWVR